MRDLKMPDLWKLILAGIGAYAAICVYVYYVQSGLIYFPNMPGRDLVATPENIGLAYQDIEFVTEDDVSLHGWFIATDDAAATVLFFHGNAGNISHRLESIEIFHRLGLNVFIIDYRGYGQSEGKTSEKGTYRDAEAAWDYLIDTRGIDARQIIIFGRSLGASIAAWLASKHTPGALIIESGFTSVPSMGQRLYPLLPIRWLTYFKYDTRKYVKHIACPVLVAHSRNDEIIPYDEGREIYDAAHEPKTFLEMRGGHNDGFLATGGDYVEGLRSFINGMSR